MRKRMRCIWWSIPSAWKHRGRHRESKGKSMLDQRPRVRECEVKAIWACWQGNNGLSEIARPKTDWWAPAIRSLAWMMAALKWFFMICATTSGWFFLSGSCFGVFIHDDCSCCFTNHQQQWEQHFSRFRAILRVDAIVSSVTGSFTDFQARHYCRKRMYCHWTDSGLVWEKKEREREMCTFIVVWSSLRSHSHARRSHHDARLCDSR